MKVIIHACDRRLWYVNEFLVPALRDQGIEPSIYNDDDHRGCLRAYIHSFLALSGDESGTWHLEDDVYPCRKFAERAKVHDNGIVHGFFHRFEQKTYVPGWVSVADASVSFPCFRMPNRLAVEFAEWFQAEGQFFDKYARWIEENKHVDSIMLDFLKERHPEEKVYNFTPSIVEHIDTMIGGSVVNRSRQGPCRAEYFDDQEIIDNLKIRLAERNASLF